MKKQSTGNRIIRVFGLRRSGNHMFINWLLSQQTAEVRFYNNADMNILEMREPDKVYAGSNNQTVKIYSFEDRNLNLAAQRRWINQSLPVLDFVIVRSPGNLFASRIKSGMTTPLFFSGMSIPELTEQYFYFGITPEKYRKRFGIKMIPVFFDKFVESEDYRKQIAESASLRYKSVALDKVDIRYGRGSSFTPYSQEAPSAAEVMNRWNGFESHPLFRKWVAEFIRLSKSDSWEHYEFLIEGFRAVGIKPRPYSWAVLRMFYRLSFVNCISILRGSWFFTWVREVAGDRRIIRMPNKTVSSTSLKGDE